MRLRANHRNHSSRRASVLIIVLWVSFGLVSLALYFANCTSLELRAADNRVAMLEAEQAIAGAVRYLSNVIATATAEAPGMLPDPMTYLHEGVPIGDAAFWLIGRATDETADEQVVFGLVDEASKLNLNTATAAMMNKLPRMTAELAAAIVDWRDTDSNASENGAEDEIYGRLTTPYKCKNAPFETVEELRLVYGMTYDILFDEDANLNGVLDPNENDGSKSQPADNANGKLDRGVLSYFTVHTQEPNTRTNGSARVDVSGPDTMQLAALLQEVGMDTTRMNEILRRFPAGPPGGGGPGGGAGGTTGNIRSLLEFYIRSGMTQAEFALIETEITVTTNQFNKGLVNVNTASEAVLTCVPGIGETNAPALIAYRLSNPDSLHTVAWVKEAIDEASAIQAGPFLTGRSYQFTADIAAVGHQGRGYQRAKFIFDTSEGPPKVRQRQDLTHLGWALGQQVREEVRLAREQQP